MPPDKRFAPELPDPARIDFEESGRGIAIIVALATDFGWRRRGDGAGKVMWFTLDIAATDA